MNSDITTSSTSTEEPQVSREYLPWVLMTGAHEQASLRVAFDMNSPLLSVSPNDERLINGLIRHYKEQRGNVIGRIGNNIQDIEINIFYTTTRTEFETLKEFISNRGGFYNVTIRGSPVGCPITLSPTVFGKADISQSQVFDAEYVNEIVSKRMDEMLCEFKKRDEEMKEVNRKRDEEMKEVNRKRDEEMKEIIRNNEETKRIFQAEIEAQKKEREEADQKKRQLLLSIDESNKKTSELIAELLSIEMSERSVKIE